jgi:hypothetical protein
VRVEGQREEKNNDLTAKTRRMREKGARGEGLTDLTDFYRYREKLRWPSSDSLPRSVFRQASFPRRRSRPRPGPAIAPKVLTGHR